MADKEKSVEEQYKEDVAVTEDDATFVTSYLKLTRIYDEILIVGDLFYAGDIDAYEALTKIKILLNIINESKNEIEKSL